MDSPSGGEFGQMAGEASGHTWETLICSEGELGMFGRGSCPSGLQLPPPTSFSCIPVEVGGH